MGHLLNVHLNGALRREFDLLRQEAEELDIDMERSFRETERLQNTLRQREAEVQRLRARVEAQRARRQRNDH